MNAVDEVVVNSSADASREAAQRLIHRRPQLPHLPTAASTASAAGAVALPTRKKKTLWGKLKQKRSSLARLAAFDKAKRAVHELTDVADLVVKLKSEKYPDRQEAVLGLTRAGVSSLKHLPRIVEILEHEKWTMKLTGLEALAAIAFAGPTRDRLAQAEERLRIIQTEINGNAQRYDRLSWKFCSENSESRSPRGSRPWAWPCQMGLRTKTSRTTRPSLPTSSLPYATAHAMGQATVKRRRLQRGGQGSGGQGARGCAATSIGVPRGANAKSDEQTGEEEEEEEEEEESESIDRTIKNKQPMVLLVVVLVLLVVLVVLLLVVVVVPLTKRTPQANRLPERSLVADRRARVAGEGGPSQQQREKRKRKAR